MKLHKILVAMACLALSGTAMAVNLWQDDDPASAGITTLGNGLSVTPIASPVGNSATIGQVEESSLGGAFGNMTATADPFDVTAYQGEDYVFSFDYYVPASSVASGNDLFYIQINVNGANAASAGFINIAGAPKDTWQTFSYTNSFTNIATSAEFLWLYVDGGFSGPPTTTAGTVMYVDNVLVTSTVGEVPPPVESMALFDWEDFAGIWWSNGADYVESDGAITMVASGRTYANDGGDGAGGTNGFAMKGVYSQDAAPGYITMQENGEDTWFVVKSIDVGGGGFDEITPSVQGVADGNVMWTILPGSNSTTYTSASTGNMSSPIDRIVWNTGVHSDPNNTFGNTIDNLSIETAQGSVETIYAWNWTGWWTPHGTWSWYLGGKGMSYLGGQYTPYWWCGDDYEGSPSVIKHRPGLADLPANGGFGGLDYDTGVGGQPNAGVYVTKEVRPLVSNETLRVTFDYKMYVNGNDSGRFMDMFFSTVGNNNAKSMGLPSGTGNELGFVWHQHTDDEVRITFAADDPWMNTKPPVLTIPLTSLGINVVTADHDGDNLEVKYAAVKSETNNIWLCSMVVSNKDTAASFSVENVPVDNATLFSSSSYFCIFTPDDLSNGDTSGASSAGYDIDNLNVALLHAPLPPVLGYDAYLEEYGMAGQPYSGAYEDFDADGMLNIYEYGWGGDPTNILVQGVLPELVVSNGVAYYTGLELTDPLSGITYEVLTTPNLVAIPWAEPTWDSSASTPYDAMYDSVQRGLDTSAGQFFKTIINTNAP